MVGTLAAALMPAARPVAAQSPGPAAPAFTRESWSVTDGLPINSINALARTPDGYLWIATTDGLARFDGVRFTVFNAGNTRAFPSNRFFDLHVDRQGTLWTITEQQHLLQYRRGQFVHIDSTRGLDGGALVLHEEPNGELLLTTTRGVGVLKDGRYVPLVRERATATERVAALRQRDGTLWYPTRQGLEHVGGPSGRSLRLPPGLQSGFITGLAVDSTDRLWVGTTAGLWALDASGAREVRHNGAPVTYVHSFFSTTRGDSVYALGGDGMLLVVGGQTTRVAQSLPGRTLRPTLASDSAGALWFAVGPQVYRNNRLISAPSGTDADQISARTVTSLLVDREGSVWFGTRGDGLHRLRQSLVDVIGVPEGLPTGNIYPLYEDPWGAMWVGTFEKGPSRIVAGAARPTNFGTTGGFPIFPRSFFSDRPDRLWIGALDGLYACTLPTVRCTRDRSTPVAPAAVVHAVHQDARGQLWAGTHLGVLRYTGTSWVPVAGFPTGVGEVRGFANSTDGALWMATGAGGLVRFAQNRFERIAMADGLPGDVIRALYVDVDGWLWVGTEGRGLARLDPRAWSDRTRSKRIATISTEQGLFDAGVHVILADEADHLWMSSNRGIFRMARAELHAVAEGRARTARSTSFTDREGMRNREANGGMQWPAVRARDGRLWFATQDGVVIMDPRRLNLPRRTVPIVVERVRAADTAMVPTGSALRLGVDQRTLTIEYTALALDDPRNVRFRYRLEGYDADWVEAGVRRTAFYTRVPPGRYTFRVQAATPTGGWTEEGATLTLDLAFRVWETLPFRLGLGLLLVVGTLVAVVTWSRAVRRRAGALERLVDERTATLREREQQLAQRNARLAELDQAKSRFFANVSHEFRTPLMLTIGPLEDAQRALDQRDAPAGTSVEMALRNARRLLRLVNQILDVARLEAGEMRLRRAPLDLAQFTRALTDAFLPAAVARGQSIDVDTPVSVRGAFDADAIEKVITNLLSNAIKFTPTGGRIGVSIMETDAGVMLRVTDTGPGIAAHHLPHVFERFYQIDDALTRAEPGTGIGLALVKELVALHGGTVTVANGLPATGAVFTVTLPLEDVGGNGLGTAAPSIDLAALALAPVASSDVADADAADARPDLPTLLIVDDSTDLRAYVRGHFTPAYRVIEAADGAEGIALARRELPDVVISDLMMPNTDGHELVRALRADPETEYLPIILLTARTDLTQRLAGLTGGADDYLTKPFEMRELLARVDNLIAMRRRLRTRLVSAEPAPPFPSGDAAAEHRDDPPRNHADVEFVQKLEAAVQLRLADPEFGVAELAFDVAMDRTHLFRRTRQLLGVSPSDVIRRARLERAASLLGDRSTTVSHVAYAVGFNSLSHFTRSFQAQFGVTPSVYRTGAIR